MNRNESTPLLNRLGWIDTAKAVGIVLVVLGHSGALPWPAYRVLYAFHMPMFFIISGYLLKEDQLTMGFRPYLQKLLLNLLPAYFAFAALGFLFWFFAMRHLGIHGESTIKPITLLIAIIYGSGVHDKTGLQPSVLWFFTCLITSQVIMYFVTKFSKMYFQIIAIFLLAWLGFFIRNRVLPWQLETSLVAVGFIYLGRLCRQMDIMAAFHRHPINWAIPLLGVGLVCALSNSTVDLRTSTFGTPILFYGAAVCLSLAIFSWAALINWESRLIRVLAKNTIIIFPIHLMVFTVIKGATILVFHFPPILLTKLEFGIAVTILNLVTIFALIPGFERYTPWIYGMRFDCRTK